MPVFLTSLPFSFSRVSCSLATAHVSDTMRVLETRLWAPLVGLFSLRLFSSVSGKSTGSSPSATVFTSGSMAAQESLAVEKLENPVRTEPKAEPVLINRKETEERGEESVVWPKHVDTDYACTSIFCYTPLLQKSLEVGIKRDWRGLKLKRSTEEAKKDFDELILSTMDNPSRRDIEVYTARNFEAADDIFIPSKPEDWTENPPSLMRLEDGSMRAFALELNAIWPELTRKTARYVEEMPDRYAYIYVPNNHIVPGGNFSSFYYWDSYWIAKGLLASGMNGTVRGILENFLSMVQRYGFVPNGGMVCYERRSQPPFLIPMVYDYVESSGDFQFLREHVRTLDAEFGFWLKNRTMMLEIDNAARRVLHYDGQAGNPRPERLKQDIFAGAMWTNFDDKRRFYRAVKSACETGWDFSSRWIVHNGTNVGNVSYTAATSIIPIDLQAFMAKNAKVMAEFHAKLGHEPQKNFYLEFHAELCQNMTDVFWNPETQMWGDYDSINMKRRPYYYLSNISPLWAGCSAPGKTLDQTAEAVVEYLRRNGALDYPGGVPVSMEVTGEQWDFPNSWTPLNHLLFEALLQSESKLAQEVALSVAEKTIKAGYEGFAKYGSMFEKYDVTNLGEPGGGGEYIVQKGFGWTNGAILDMIVRTNRSVRIDSSTQRVTAPPGGGRFNESKVANLLAVGFLIAFAVGLSAWTTWSVVSQRQKQSTVDDFEIFGKKSKRWNADDARELARLQSDSDDATSDSNE